MANFAVPRAQHYYGTAGNFENVWIILLLGDKCLCNSNAINMIVITTNNTACVYIYIIYYLWAFPCNKIKLQI